MELFGVSSIFLSPSFVSLHSLSASVGSHRCGVVLSLYCSLLLFYTPLHMLHGGRLMFWVCSKVYMLFVGSVGCINTLRISITWQALLLGLDVTGTRRDLHTTTCSSKVAVTLNRVARHWWHILRPFNAGTDLRDLSRALAAREGLYIT